LASDISNIIKSEIATTLESLLSLSSNVESVSLLGEEELKDNQCIKVNTTFDFGSKSSVWNFFIPAKTATQFEYLMLGGVTDLKDSIDDEITDAVKEIISTISGSVVTSVNAQGFDDINGMKFTLGDASIVNCNEIVDKTQSYKFVFKLNDDSFDLVIEFDSNIVKFLSSISGKKQDDSSQNSNSSSKEVTGAGSILNSLLGEESVDNLRLLFDIKMKLSVRLGTKVCLLRDVISWDIGEIIELSQMTNEPLDILVNGVIIGKGEAVIVDGKFGVKIKSIGVKKIN
jgi:flagellar motor switch protein FliN/FliY